MLSNILPQTRHTIVLFSFVMYALHGFLMGRKINLPLLILNHLFRCRNQKRASLLYARMITTLLQRSSMKIKSAKLYNTSMKLININTFIYRNIFRGDGGVYTYVDSKKRKMDDQAPPPRSTKRRFSCLFR